jgi:hypothetical protein
MGWVKLYSIPTNSSRTFLVSIKVLPVLATNRQSKDQRAEEGEDDTQCDRGEEFALQSQY